METMRRVLLGKAETEGNGCGQTVVLEGEGGKNMKKTGGQSRRKMEKT